MESRRVVEDLSFKINKRKAELRLLREQICESIKSKVLEK